jgi:hypothetical protein
MADVPYSNREIDSIVKTLSEKISESRDDLARQLAVYAEQDKQAHMEVGKVMFRVEAQTTKTNGRVSSLENWRWLITGGLGVLITLVLPILLIVVRSFIK